ncbi:MAG: cellulase family glycosylhydrolase [Phycisphaerae bacterium]
MTQLQSARGGPVTPELARVARRGNLAAGRFARFGLTLLCVTPAIALGAPPAAIDFWNQQRRGANLFDAVETRTRLEAAAKMGIEFVRIAPDKWKAAGRDFLIGNADDYRGIPEADLAQLRAVLDEAHAAGLKVVLTCLSLPGARWKQHNGDDNDLRLWRDFRYHQQSAAFWRDLAKALRGHPALVGFNPLNEPRPEAMVRPPLASWQVAEWHKSVADTPADINRFYAVVCKAIRDVDPDTPIIVDASFDATVPGFAALRPVPVRHVLYAAHMYDPFELTCFRENQNRFSFPGPMAGGEGPSVRVDREWLAGWLAPLASWAGRNQVPPTRILVGEFGCDRRVRARTSIFPIW